MVGMAQGRALDEGTHAALLARGGVYAGLWARQSGGFLGEDAVQTAESRIIADQALDLPGDSA
jgi:ATP-binding cassette subfamily B multidrug efflux pump